MVKKRSEEGIVTMGEGLLRQTLVHGEHTHLVKFNLGKGGKVPLHDHPHEQTGYLLSGSMRLAIGGKKYDLEEGDSWCVAGGVPHEADVMEDTVIIEVFSPVREDYL